MKRKLINSFIILSASSAITKLFSIVNRMVLARMLPSEAMNLFILVIPTLSLCITLGQLGIPSAVFRLITHPKYQNKKVIISAVSISVFSCTLITTVLGLSSSYISHSLLHSSDAMYPLLSLCLFIPVIGISGIIKNYFLAKENIYLVAKAQFFEEVFRLLFTYIMLKLCINAPIAILVSITFLSMTFGEIVAIIYMLIRLNRSTKYTIKTIFTNTHDLLIKDMLNIALPVTGTRLYHSFVSFLEPIILLAVITTSSATQIKADFAIISGFVVSLLVTPTFFNNVIYRLYLPIVIKDLSYKNGKIFLRNFFFATFACFLISLPFTTIFYFYPDICLSIIYNTTDGANYLQYMAIPFTIFYLQTPLSAIMHALNKNRALFLISFFECTIELLMAYFLAPIFGVLIIAISLLVGMCITLFFSVCCVYYYIFIKKENIDIT